MEKPSSKRSSDLGDIQEATKAKNHSSVKTWRLEGQQEIERDASTNLLKIMKTAKLLNDACDLLTELEHYSEDDYTNYRLDELFREVVKLDERALDDTKEITIRIIEHLIEWGAWDKTDQPESEWYPQKLQDDIQNIINEALGITAHLAKQQKEWMC